MSKERKAEMIEMRENGYTYHEIGKAFGISRQRVQTLIGGQMKSHFRRTTPKKANDFTIPRDVLTEGTDYSMEFKERFAIQTQNNIAYTRRKYEEMGIAIVGDHDDLFYNVRLPEGWKIEDTDHPMWNVLLNDKHEEVATFFYKAAFYDRDAFINLPKNKEGENE